MTVRPILILDLDGTLLHTEVCLEGIAVPGRTRFAYLSRSTIDCLIELSGHLDLVIATGRSFKGTQPLLEGLLHYGIRVEALVLEDGGLLGSPGRLRPMEPERRWDSLRQRVEAKWNASWPRFEWQLDFEACLVARTETPSDSETLKKNLFEEMVRCEPSLRTYRDGRKVYLAGAQADKWQGLQHLLGEQAPTAMGVGDGMNDLCWLSKIALPYTLQGGAPEVVTLVNYACGSVSPQRSHAGIGEILHHILDKVRGVANPPPHCLAPSS